MTDKGDAVYFSQQGSWVYNKGAGEYIELSKKRWCFRHERVGQVSKRRRQARLGFQPAGSNALALKIPVRPLTPPVASEEDGDVVEIEDFEGGKKKRI